MAAAALDVEEEDPLLAANYGDVSRVCRARRFHGGNGWQWGRWIRRCKGTLFWCEEGFTPCEEQARWRSWLCGSRLHCAARAVGRSKRDELGNGEIREQDQQGVRRGCRRHCFCSWEADRKRMAQGKASLRIALQFSERRCYRFMIFFVCFSAIPSSRLARLVFAGGDPSKEGVLHQQGSGSTASQPGRYSPEWAWTREDCQRKVSPLPKACHLSMMCHLENSSVFWRDALCLVDQLFLLWQVQNWFLFASFLPCSLSTLYTMPCWDDHHNINSFDVFIWGNSITFPACFLPLLPQYRLWFIPILILNRIWEWELWAHPYVDWFLHFVCCDRGGDYFRWPAYTWCRVAYQASDWMWYWC